MSVGYHRDNGDTTRVLEMPVLGGRGSVVA